MKTYSICNIKTNNETQTKDGTWYTENGFEIKQEKEVRLIDADNAISVLRILSDKCGEDNVFEQAISVLESVPEIEVIPKSELFEQFDRITTAWNGKQRFFPQKDGTIYDRNKCDDLDSLDDAVNRFCNELSNDYFTHQERLKEIADALSEKFAYMNTCLNERDIILGHLGVKRPNKIHCDTDCTIIKCKNNHCYKQMPFAQPEPYETNRKENE